MRLPLRQPERCSRLLRPAGGLLTGREASSEAHSRRSVRQGREGATGGGLTPASQAKRWRRPSGGLASSRTSRSKTNDAAENQPKLH